MKTTPCIKIIEISNPNDVIENNMLN